ncbi:hypothetical protein [Alysiella crassa]|uniref:Uncharacterized protein n=1 Tax=Alysiella crassa TaxID=153491 RepID=A0A376BMC5_9NEIS|nr:hypothetical protein [Alysiella crassa]UOP06945.1 hypothetical protein LVJ80_00095 [Alysiella crassa]SSY70917.1 Uncharacterised protein [Alysiella crassa]
MFIYSHIICPRCHFLYCYHLDNNQVFCANCRYQWQQIPQNWIRHATILNGQAVPNPNMKSG